ncbi:glycosyltransferase involved in cell wall biosynthesis [Clostridium tetanomorphum]|uniref:Glycosyltransferase family 2 protein n=1 Tax=Clostridium tetanomorphum TaxID=1553 RepID=A0A923J1T9_CLOTT|nr:glycosyltransferase family 2 protein [Clostridium tetanomorphum]KAJ49428.1 succinoglycan biosynthesis protein exoA [Clostridium tetanomorphum DSM 665]KAJ52307.1 succinoglycan biosynthesis protein exoA [Clostridium tetanomorphum DSM 665]MBC2399552.1 glycosyltransferase family 2 protein [Clostridium tetanomorphum]MBP1866308.1 glycosyltransferase involved in cell wall biosynthesis [Clostridium tetanomorphum]NRS85799.1 glycosyltransferase involved in cell wall biosynthesis [Clostridium tetanomo
MDKKENLTVSIVIPCRNEESYIKKCLDSFINQTYPKELYEVLVCDGMSIDSTREIVKEYEEDYDNIKLIDNEGLSAPKGMNKGIKYSKADVIIIFGAHAYAKEDFIEENIKTLIANDVGCVGGPIETINEDDKGLAISMAMSSPFGVGNALFRYAQEETYVDTVAFGCYRKSVLDKVGYFDEELVRNQDDELNFRVVKNGYNILLSPKIRSYYYSRSSLKKLWKQYYQYGFWKVRVMQKHGRTASIRHLVPAAFVVTNILGISLGIFFKWILYLWFIELALYAIGDIVSSSKLIKKNKKIWKYIFFIFPILHISYGLGFLNGLMNFYILKSKKAIEKNTKMSR